jgi:hypothetical protein
MDSGARGENIGDNAGTAGRQGAEIQRLVLAEQVFAVAL